jgi:CHAT domain-containing protein
VPFAALQDAQNRFLIEKHTLVTAPAIQVLNLTPNTNQGSGALIVGDPIMPKLEDMKLAPLPGARAEAIAIGQLLNTPPLLGAEATKKAVLSRMTQAQTIHFATHGLLDTFSGEVPGAIALAPQGKDNGLLTASEIFDLRLKANLVVLSACDTGRGDITGDGVIGLSRTFMAAGTPSIIVSLWQVPDEPTKFLMTEFYRQLRSSGGRPIDKAKALRQATLRTLKQYPNIADWAGFLLIGQAQD